MRLLVYGGTQFSERRRIGKWPDSISAQILQSRKGLSEQRIVYGLGVLDESPFVFLRGMQTHDRRGYPITVLLDPGVMWARVRWNGALLLRLILDDLPAIGGTLLSSPESVRSAGDLERLLSEVTDSAAAREDVTKKAVGNGESERLLCLWAGALTINKPLTIGLRSNSLGLEPYPPYKNMAARLDLLPESFRSAVGWVVGGDTDYSAAFNTKLIFDVTKASEPDVERQVSSLVARGEGWLEAWNNVQANAAKIKSGSLNELLQRPLFSWELTKLDEFPEYGRETFFDDLRALSNLLGPSSRTESADPEVNQSLADIYSVQRLSPLNKVIEEAFNNRSRKSQTLLNTAETHLVLRKVYESNEAAFDLDSYEDRLDPETAISYLVERRLYPSKRKLPRPVRVDVCERLLRTENVEDMAAKLSHELGWLDDLDAADRLRLVRAAVERTSELPDGMTCWLFWSRDSDPAGHIRAATEETTRRRLHDRSGSWQQNYLMFANDFDGEVLRAAEPETIQSIIEIALQNLQTKSTKPESLRLKQISDDWLEMLGRSEARDRVPLEMKMKIARAACKTWSGLDALDQAFNYDAREFTQLTARHLDPEEQRFLISELAEFAARTLDGAAPPNLRTVAEVFSFEDKVNQQTDFFEALGPLLEIKPDLGRETAQGWVVGWCQLADRIILGPSNRQLLDKFRSEALRWLKSERQEPPGDWGFRLKDLWDQNDFQHLRDLLDALLFQGGRDKDVVYAQRILKFKTELKKLSSIMPSIIEAGIQNEQQCETFFRRFGNQEKARKALQAALDSDLLETLKAAEERLVREKTNRYLEKIVGLFCGSAIDSECAEEFLQLQIMAAGEGLTNKRAFSDAVKVAFAQIPQEGDLFLKRFADSSSAIEHIEQYLPLEARDELKRLLLQHEKTQLSIRIEFLLSAEDGKLDLADLLRKQHRNKHLREAASAAVRRCLQREPSRKSFYRHFMLGKKNNVSILRIERYDKINHLTHLFANVEPRVRWEILRFALGVDEDAFNLMVIRGFQHLRKYGSDDDDPLKKSVFAFLWTETGKVAKEQLFVGAGAKKRTIEDALSQYKILADEMNDPPQEEQRTEEGEPQGFINRIFGI